MAIIKNKARNEKKKRRRGERLEPIPETQALPEAQAPSSDYLVTPTDSLPLKVKPGWVGLGFHSFAKRIFSDKGNTEDLRGGKFLIKALKLEVIRYKERCSR